MPQIKEFYVGRSYLANYGNGDRGSDSYCPVNSSKYEDLLEELKNNLSSPKLLKQLLKKDFIYPGCLGKRSYDTHNTFPKEPYRMVRNYTYSGFGSFGQVEFIKNPNYGCGQRNSVTLEKYKVAPFLEELVVNHQEDLLNLLEIADEASKKVLLDFTELDLSSANLSQLDYSLVTFTLANLSETQGITQEILDQSIDYQGAKLPKGMIAAWFNEQKNTVLARVQDLLIYGEKLSLSHSESGKAKGVLALAVGKELRDKINQATKFNGAFQKDFLKILNKQEAEFSKRRFYSLKMIISNIILLVLGFGIGYLAAGLAHKQQTGRFLFFQRTETEQKRAAIQECFYTKALS